jgi:hypothetical protein
MPPRRALDMIQSGHVNLAACVNNLASVIHNRFHHHGATMLADLQKSIALCLRLHPPGNPLRAELLESLATALHRSIRCSKTNWEPRGRD